MTEAIATDFLRGEKQGKPQQLRYLKHCVRKKITTLRENDLPAIMANKWARPLFQTAIGNNSGGAIDLNSASGQAPEAEIYPSKTNDLRARGQVRIKASASGADNRGFESRRARPIPSFSELSPLRAPSNSVTSLWIPVVEPIEPIASKTSGS